MALTVALVRDTIRKDGSLVPRVVQRRTIEVDTLLTEMAKDTGLEITDMQAVFNRFFEALVTYLRNGDHLRTPIGTFSASVRTTATTSIEGDDPAHPTMDRTLESDGLRIRFRADSALLQRLRLACSIQIVDAPPLKVPVVQRVENTESEDAGSTGSAGELVQVFGSRLSFDKSDLDLGVFFVAADGTETRVTGYGRIGTNYVTCKIPQVPAGSYSVAVRTRPTERDVRSGVCGDLFVVN